MTSRDHSEPPLSHPPGPSPPPPASPPGQAVAQHAWRFSGRVVAGVGQLLLWMLNGLGRLLRPLAMRVGARLYGPAAPLPRWIDAWRNISGSWYFAPLTGLALTITALAELAAREEQVVSVAGLFVLASTLPLIWRREILRPVAAMVLGAYAAGLLSGQEPLLVATTAAALYTLYTLAQHLPRQSVGVLAAGGLVTAVIVSLASDDRVVPWPAALVAVLAAIGLGDARRVVESAERTHAEAQELTSETLTRLSTVQREQAVMRERARIARELHDVVAHSVSMIAVQAETAPYTMDRLSPDAERGYAEIARTAREALVEMRRLLSVLRADANPEPESAPQPRLDGLPDLIDQHRGAGGNVQMAVGGRPRSLSATVELSAYRIVQEALTNARRHAPGADVRVELSYLPDRLAVRVVDNGPNAETMILNPVDTPRDAPPGPADPREMGHPGPAAPYGFLPGGGSSQGTPQAPPSAPPPQPPPQLQPRGPGGPGGHGGHGLVGMQERAIMLGGRFSAGPVTGGGFRVEVELPFARQGGTDRPGAPGRRADRR